MEKVILPARKINECSPEGTKKQEDRVTIKNTVINKI